MTLLKVAIGAAGVFLVLGLGYWALRRYMVRKIIRENHWKRTEW